MSGSELIDLNRLVAGETILRVGGLTKHEPLEEFDLYVLVGNVHDDSFDFTNTGKAFIPSSEVHLTDIRFVDETSQEAQSEKVQKLINLRARLKA